MYQVTWEQLVRMAWDRSMAARALRIEAEILGLSVEPAPVTAAVFETRAAADAPEPDHKINFREFL